MFNWFYRLVGWDRTVTPPRLLFWFSDWTGTRSIDPLAAERALCTGYGPDWPDGLRAIAEAAPEGLDLDGKMAHYRRLNDLRTKLLRAAADAFHLDEYDPKTGTGVTDLQKLYVLRHFTDYHAGLGRYLAGG